MERLSTGVEILDRRLDGGVPAGSLVALVAPPESQSELLLDSFATAGPALVLTGARFADEVEARLVADFYAEDDLAVAEFSTPDLADDVDSLLADVPEGGRLVVDGADPIEALDPEDQRDTLRAIRGVLRDREAVGMVHCLGVDDGRGRTRTLHHADAVWVLDLRPTTLKVENRLYVTKSRRGAALVEPVKLTLTDRVQVDTSRDI